ncbi:TfoX/Sxy family protein [Patescibacteria group bacterium]|jgi:DNA transformation protein|nr:TfoX/Sxy family protein [Patescibacteria group bacterium]
MPSKHEALVKYVAEDLLAGLKSVTVKRMFGGHGFYFGGKMFGLEANGEIFFKVNGENQSDYEKAGSHPFQYSSKDKKAVTMSYWTVPDEIMENPEEAVKWARLAIKAASASKAKK